MKKIILLVFLVNFISSGYSQTTLGLYTERTVTSTQTLNTTFGSNANENNSYPTGGTDAGTDGGTEVYEISAIADGMNTQWILNYNPRADFSTYNTLYISLRSSSPQPTVLRIQDQADVSATLDASTYGMVYDGDWHTLAIPLTDFTAAAPTIDLTLIKNVFLVKSDPAAAGDVVASTYIFYVDDVYISTATSTTWTGITSSDWNTASNWTNEVPLSTTNVIISTGTPNSPVISNTTDAVCNDLTVATNTSLNIMSGSSLITVGITSGEVTYNLNISDTNWHLISSPVANEEYNDTWITDNNIATGTTSSSNRGVSWYNNSTPDAVTGNWRYFQAGGTTTTFTPGQGYALLKTTSGDYSFTGTLNNFPINYGITQNTNEWNLVGNSSTGYLNVSDYITTNSTALSNSFQALYVFNATTGNYDALTTGQLQPGQAFFVNAASDTDVTLTSEMLSHQTNVTFYKSVIKSLELTISNTEASQKTIINFDDNATLGLDPGSDIGKFNGVNTTLSLYTHLLENNNNVGFQIQTIPNNALEGLSIPLGVDAEAGKEISFSIESLNLPEGVVVYLEDKINGTFTQLEDNDYKITLNEAISGVGNFAIQMKSSALSINDKQLEGVNIFTQNNNTIVISGLDIEEVSVSIYNILGNEVLNKSFKASSTNTINLPSLNTGIYIVKLNTVEGSLTKKVIIN